ncbi:MAG: CRTAC1 family protein [Planctomycetes bacterium]|nr:CRTAC1 family protein [Planctomycetota bacterium]
MRLMPWIIVSLSAWLLACGQDEPDRTADPESSGNATVNPVSKARLDFHDETLARGLDFRHDASMTGKRWMPEHIGGGGALFDADGDGDLDALFINGGPLPGSESLKENALYVNGGRGHFKRLADIGDLSAGADFGVGCAVADIDLDGDLDVFVTNWGEDRLYLNDGKGRFERALKSGITTTLWGSSAAFGDLNGDGLPDLYVVNYVAYDLAKHDPCYQRDIEIYCGPQPFAGQPDTLYLNLGGGRFKDITAQAFPGGAPNGKGLGVAMGDVDQDGDLDIYVANDQTPNFLFLNDGKARFEEFGILANVAVSKDGVNEAGMGIALADYDNDLREDIVVTNFENQTNAVYHAEGDLFWMEVSWESGIGYQSRPYLGWGTGLIDFDHDGLKDLFFANGHVYDNAERVNPSSTWAQKNKLHLNLGDGRFAPDAELEAMSRPQVSRGAYFGDVDQDGDMDILVCNLNDAPRLLINQRAGAVGGHWALVDAVHQTARTPIPGARIVITAGRTSQVQCVQGGYSIFGHSDYRAHFGLGGHATIDRLEVRWPQGGTDRYEALPADRKLVVDPRGKLLVVDLVSNKVLETRQALGR